MSLATLAVTLPLADDGWHHDGWGHMGSGWWVLMAIVMVAFWLLVAGAIYWLVRNGLPTAGKSAARHGSPARQILDKRLAEGEIDVEEYERRRAALDPESRPPGDGD